MSKLLRDVLESDLETFFEHQQDEGANYMVAFTSPDPKDRAAFDALWERIMGNETGLKQTIVVDGAIAGNIVCFDMFEQRSVGYRLGREFWGKGIATKALAEFLEQIPERPLYGRCVKDNIGSRRVLEKCGFKLVAEERAYANGRGEEVDELILKLD